MIKFEPGEVAVLLNDHGGRLFTVHSTNKEGRVIERSREMAMAIRPYIDVQPPATPMLCGGCRKPVEFDLVLGSRCECSKKATTEGEP